MTVDDPAAPDLDVPRRSWAVPVIVAALAAVVLAAGIILLSTRAAGDDPAAPPADAPAGADDPATVPGVSTDVPAGGCPDTTLPAPASLPEDDVAARTDTASAALVGCTEAEGTTKAEAAGWKVRVVMQDGKSQMGTMDYRLDRVGLTVDGGVITGVEVG